LPKRRKHLPFAHADPSSLLLDDAERWLLQGQPVLSNGTSCFYLSAVVLHELGHCIGLVHSNARGDVMAPYYKHDAVTLTERDRMRASQLYGATLMPPPRPTPLGARAPPPKPSLAQSWPTTWPWKPEASQSAVQASPARPRSLRSADDVQYSTSNASYGAWYYAPGWYQR
jgi:hypothetical protein